MLVNLGYPEPGEVEWERVLRLVFHETMSRLATTEARDEWVEALSAPLPAGDMPAVDDPDAALYARLVADGVARDVVEAAEYVRMQRESADKGPVERARRAHEFAAWRRQHRATTAAASPNQS